MKYEQLVDFIANRMRMSHIYQPLLIMSLIDAGGTATLRQLAVSFLSRDESEIMYYEKKIKEMPLRVLKKHGVLESQGNVVSLTVENLDLQQRSVVRMRCEQRIQEYIEKRGLKVWDYRLLSDPVPDSLRYKVLKASDGRCELCGATKKERPLDVDHIIPRSRGGKNKMSNLQVLCSRCNRSKGNRDTADFREWRDIKSEPGCEFCSAGFRAKAIYKNGSVFVVKDKYPVTEGHLLVVPYRHNEDFFSMSSQERSDAESLVRKLHNEIEESDSSVLGFNIGCNCGTVAGQSITHAHIHLIPRRKGDTPASKGGVRGVIPEKMSY